MRLGKKKLTCWQGSWYHLQRVVSGNDVHIACGCPSGRDMLTSACIHKRYIKENYEKKEFLQQGDEDRTFPCLLMQTHAKIEQKSQ